MTVAEWRPASGDQSVVGVVVRSFRGPDDDDDDDGELETSRRRRRRQRRPGGQRFVLRQSINNVPPVRRRRRRRSCLINEIQANRRRYDSHGSVRRRPRRAGPRPPSRPPTATPVRPAWAGPGRGGRGL